MPSTTKPARAGYAGAGGPDRTLRTVPRPPGLPHRVASHASGGRDLWSPPLDRAPDDGAQGVSELLHEVLDPELPVSLVDLGLIYGVSFDEGTVVVELTFTATACPCMDFIREDIRDRLLQERWIDEVDIREVWDPPWTTDRITPSGKAALKALGVGA